MKNIFKALMIFMVSVLFAQAAYAAVGCSLTDPDRDVKRIFPASTGYKTTFITIKEKGGEALKQEVEEKLKGDGWKKGREMPDPLSGPFRRQL